MFRDLSSASSAWCLTVFVRRVQHFQLQPVPLRPSLETLAACDRALRDAQARAAAIDAATFDLKAVNAHARVERDERTPTQVLAAIAGHGVAVDAALARLQALLATDDAPLR